jgi:hypothetical protein
MSDCYRNYLRDLGCLLREAALEAKRGHIASKGTEDASFKSGRSMAYYEVVSLMKQQAAVFNIPDADIAFDGFDPERDTL